MTFFQSKKSSFKIPDALISSRLRHYNRTEELYSQCFYYFSVGLITNKQLTIKDEKANDITAVFLNISLMIGFIYIIIDGMI